MQVPAGNTFSLCKQLADAKVARVVDGGFRAQGTAFLGILFDPRFL